VIGRDPAGIRAKYAELRGMCDPRGYDLLDALENAMLRDNAMLDMHERVGALQEKLAGGHSVHVDSVGRDIAARTLTLVPSAPPVFACNPDESAGAA